MAELLGEELDLEQLLESLSLLLQESTLQLLLYLLELDWSLVPVLLVIFVIFHYWLIQFELMLSSILDRGQVKFGQDLSNFPLSV